MFELTNQQLRKYLLKFLPLLEQHHKYSEIKWRKAELSKAAYEHVKQRYVVASLLNVRKDVKDEQLLVTCSEITIDIKSGINLLTDEEEKAKYNQILKEWYEIFHHVGYIDNHPVFNKPEKNLTAFEDFEKKHKTK